MLQLETHGNLFIGIPLIDAQAAGRSWIDTHFADRFVRHADDDG